MAEGRAKKGGEIGKNGEFYKGGTFLPTTKMPKRSPQAKRKGTGRVPVAPKEWAVRPSPDHRPLFSLVGVYARLEDDGTLTIADTAAKTANYCGVDLQEIEEEIAAYNAGKRWCVETPDGRYFTI